MDPVMTSTRADVDARVAMDDASPRLYAKSQEDLLIQSSSNPAPTRIPPPIAALAGNFGERHVLVFVGLPLRGKRTIALRLRRYLRFFHGARCRAFDVTRGVDGETLREFLCGDDRSNGGAEDDRGGNGGEFTDEEFYHSGPSSSKHVDSGRVAVIYSSDADKTFYSTWSGTSKERRRHILRELSALSTASSRIKTIFIEITLTSESLVEEVLRQRVARDVRKGLCASDAESVARHESSWRRRIDEYKKLYVTLQEDGSEDDLSYIKLYNYGETVRTNKMRAYLAQRIVQFLTATHPTAHKIYLCRHGESEYNVTGRLGGNSPLTQKGVAFAEILGRFALEKICGMAEDESTGAWVETPSTRRSRLWTSSLIRTIQTAQFIAHPMVVGASSPDREQHGDVATHWEQMSPRVYRNIDEIFAGDCEGMTPEEIVEKNPQAAYLRSMDKIGYRYPRGESYFDLISRLEPCIQEMESYTEPLLVVSHQAILRLIFAYLTGTDRERAPGMNSFAQNVIYEITLDAYCEDAIDRYHADVAARERSGRDKSIDGSDDASHAFPSFVIAHDFRRDVEALSAVDDAATRRAMIRDIDFSSRVSRGWSPPAA